MTKRKTKKKEPSPCRVVGFTHDLRKCNRHDGRRSSSPQAKWQLAPATGCVVWFP